MATLFSESWTGSDLAVWDGGRWKNRHAQFNGAINILSNQGNLNCGTNAGEANGYAFGQTIESFGDFELTVDMTAQANTTGAADGHKVGVCFRGENDSMNPSGSGASYRIYFEWLATDTIYLQEKATTVWSTITSSVYSVAVNDVLHLVLRCEGSNIKFKVYKNAESVPESWLFDQTDTTLASGSFAFQIFAGTDSTANSIRLDDMVVSSLTNPAVRPMRRSFA